MSYREGRDRYICQRLMSFDLSKTGIDHRIPVLDLRDSLVCYECILNKKCKNVFDNQMRVTEKSNLYEICRWRKVYICLQECKYHNRERAQL